MVSPPKVYSQSISLTDSRIEHLTNIGGLRPLFVRDTRLSGFGVKVTPQDVKSYFVEVRLPLAKGGGTKRLTLGRYPLIRLLEARKTALETLRDLRYGSGTSQSRITNKITLKDLAGAFLRDKEPMLRPATITDYRMVLEGPYFSPWMLLPVEAIKRRDVLDRYRYLCQQNGVGMANKAMRVLSSTINYGKAVEPSIEDCSNPIRVLAEARAKRLIKPRTSFIPLDQVGRWLDALDRYKSDVRPQEEASRRADVWLLMCPPQQCQVRVSKVRVEDYLISVSGDVETQIPLA